MSRPPVSARTMATATITFTPTAGFTGTATVPYTITDENGKTSTADLIVTVDPAPAAPPVATDDTATKSAPSSAPKSGSNQDSLAYTGSSIAEGAGMAGAISVVLGIAALIFSRFRRRYNQQ